jgi:type II restriction enzyme
MPRKALRTSHLGIKMNSQSAKMEKRLAAAIAEVEETIASQFGLTAVVEPRLYLDALIGELNRLYAKTIGVQFEQAFRGPTRTSMEPDGGFMWIKEWGEEPRRYVLVAEAKRQGVNDVRKLEGKGKQRPGNAIERLGKNMRGFDALFLGEKITPFVCFGEGCDFATDVTIIDRVATMNGLLPLNRVFVDKIALRDDMLKPTSLFFRVAPWTPEEMFSVLIDVAEQAIAYYKYEYGL